MRIPKQYGDSKIDSCPFCEKQATTKNKQEVPTCLDHKEQNLPDLKCACGDWLELRPGKYGVYFNCMKCGNINYNKAMRMNPDLNLKNESVQKNHSENNANNEVKINSETEFYQNGKRRKEITVSTNDARYFD